MLVALVLVAAVGVGATFAYLTSQSDTVKNTFAIGNVKVDLTEYKLENGQRVEGKTGFKYTRIVPGAELSKIPSAIIKKGSEDCYLFVKIENPNTTITVGDISNGWTKLGDAYPGVYYREVSYNADADQAFDVFETVTVSSEINEKAVFEDIKITAYAIQKAGFETAEAAWGKF
jgi:predicted ribosomally synthesized peptide with SipW-like signal peptide